jgi:transposase
MVWSLALFFIGSTVSTAALNAMKRGLLGGNLRVATVELTTRRPMAMLHAGLDLSRHRLDVCLLDEQGSTVQVTTAPPDADGLRGLARQTAAHGQPVRAAIESMNGARFVHDQLELSGWQVAIADAQKVKGLAPLACKTDRIDAWVLAELSRRDLVPEIWLPTPGVRAERERVRLHLVRHRTALKNRIHATLLAFGKPCPVSDLFGAGGRQLLGRLVLPEPWIGNVAAALALIDDLDDQVDTCERELRHLGADHPYVPLLMTAPGIAWVLGYTIAAEVGDITRFPSPKQAVRLHRAVPAGVPVGQPRPARPAGQERPTVPALGADRGRDPRRPPPLLPRPLPAHQATTRQATGRQGRSGGGGSQAHRGHLVHAHPLPALCSGKAPYQRSGRLTTLA